MAEGATQDRPGDGLLPGVRVQGASVDMPHEEEQVSRDIDPCLEVICTNLYLLVPFHDKIMCFSQEEKWLRK